MKKLLCLSAIGALALTLVSFTFYTLSSVDLSSHGIPVSIDAPDGAEVKPGVGNGMEFDGVKTVVMEVAKGNFILEVQCEDDSPWQSRAEYFADDVLYYETDETFVEFVVKEEFGHIVKLKTEWGTDYNCYYVMEKDDRMIEFASGLNFNEYTLEQMKEIYAAAKNAK